MNVKETYQRAAELKAEIEANARKRGNAERRVEYAALTEKIAGWERVRAAIRSKSLFHVRGPRLDSQITYSRDNIKRYATAATLDPSPASPLRALRNQLPPNWSKLIDGEAPKFPAPPKIETRTTYKIVRLAGFGLMVSLYDGSTIYAIDKRMTQRVGKRAGTDRGLGNQRHDGGWYSHESPARCLELQRNHMLAPNDNNERATYVLLECEISGQIVEFDNGKIASTHLTPRRILATYTLATMPESITA